MSKRIILVGPSCAGKNFIREKFVAKGFKADCSYTSREPRLNEINGVDYKFISKQSFEEAIVTNEFYEYVEYNGNYYGTGLDEWNECDIFIMETDGIRHIKSKDRKDCLVIFINTPSLIRMERMKERGWSESGIFARMLVDNQKFGDFSDYDLQISSETQPF